MYGTVKKKLIEVFGYPVKSIQTTHIAHTSETENNGR
jgi:hypothetical protein